MSVAQYEPRVNAGSRAMRDLRVAHLAAVDISLRYLVLPQMTAVVDAGGVALGISAPGPFVPEIEAAGVRHVALPSSTRSMNPLADARAAYGLWRILRRERPDVLHTHTPKPGIYGRIVGRLARVPLVVNTVHGLYATEDDPRAKRWVVYGLEALAARFSHAELVQNREDLELLRRLRIVPPRKLRYLGNGVDLTRFDRARLPADTRESVRAELGVADDQILVGIVGRLVAEKGHPELFEAFSLLSDRYVLVVVGPDEPEKPDALEPSLLAAARARGVRFLGMRRDVERLYAAFDMFVLPSHREGFPRAAMEAAAMGLPIVATDIRGCRQVVADGVNGLLVPVADPKALAVAIERIGDHPDLRRRMGDASAHRAGAEFDERAVVDIVLDTYMRAYPRVPRPFGRVAKRAFDVAVASTLLVLAAPLLGLVALAVRLRLGRPVLFVQERPGKDGVPFRICKFRTMRETRDAYGDLLPDAARLTRFGRVLRATSLDELPELFNVVRGDMSLVGPRPLLTEYLDRYTPEQARRHQVRPGLTGWAQVNGRNATSWEERLAADVWYVDNRTMRLDLAILARTVGLVLTRQGINQDGHATMPKFEGHVGREARP